MAGEVETKAETETEAETEAPKPKRRPIVRLRIFLVSHIIIFSVVCCVSGVLALLLMLILPKNTYISENALMPGSARSMISNREVSEAGRLLEDIVSLNLKSASTVFVLPDSGLVQENISCSAHGLSIAGIVRTPHGDERTRVGMAYRESWH